MSILEVHQLVVVQGLTSDRGKRLNGSVGKALPSSSKGTERVPVVGVVEGEIMAIKRENLQFLSHHDVWQVGAGRPNFRIPTLKGVVIHETSGQTLVQHHFNDEGRAQVNLMVISMALARFMLLDTAQNPRRAVFLPTDLNIARALQKATHNTGVHLGPKLDAIFQRTVQVLRQLQTEKHLDVAFYYAPPRVAPLDDNTGNQRLQAVLHGCYKHYPCPHEDYLDAHEVRYAAQDDDDDQVIIAHEMYLEYGLQETLAYVQHAVALGETARLTPTAMAQRDPPAFWSAVLHLDDFLHALNSAGVSTQEWQGVLQGCATSQTYWTHARRCSSSQLSHSVQGMDWGIGNTDVKHKKLSTQYAIFALVAVIDAAHKQYKGMHHKIVLQDQYKGTEIGKCFDTFGATQQKIAKLKARGNVPTQVTDQLWNKAFAQLGFGNDAMDTASDPKAFCGGGCGCTNLNILFECSKCDGAVYCSKKCQRRAWKQHKKTCSPVMTEGAQLIRQLRLQGNDISFQSGSPTAGMLESCNGPTVISEASSLGNLGLLLKLLDGKSILNFSTGHQGVNQAEFQNILAGRATSDSILLFETLYDLPILERFLVACGPLKNHQVAQASLDDALRFVGGNLHNLRIRACGFTALEWAAKKGNKEIVEWLCTDPRTQGLIHIGSPVGWACYTGKVDVARVLVEHGASPSATHPILWGNLHPLFAAAQNGQLEAIQWLVEEMGQDVHLVDANGNGITKHIKDAPNWKDIESHKQCYYWAKQKLGSNE